MTLCAFLVGCTPAAPEYRPNRLFAASVAREQGDSDSDAIAFRVRDFTNSFFGTIDAPKWPEWCGCPVELESVTRCSGPVGRSSDKVERGVFRKHCVQCHGATGDGFGPAAMLLAPYPRDFRRGTFKFKSTPIGSKPTRDDLRHTLERGIRGTSMPAFESLTHSESYAKDVDDLVEYVRFLSIRGEVERMLITKVIREDLELDNQSDEVRRIVRRIANQWANADTLKVEVPEVPSLDEYGLMDSISRGRELFRSEITACVKCHGPDGNGDGIAQDYDVWTKDWTILAGIDPSSKTEWKEMKPFGALKPVIDRPRNLILSRVRGYRGPDSPTDLFRRLVVGIEGSPMPPIARATNGNPGLTDDQIWDLVHYVQEFKYLVPNPHSFSK